ncbi:hypothetical protein HN807_13155 [Candidatus Bathyarchaeota archaeon]|jgi:hypothetical protein|nr:hypothetical protein [Candidatus Bathyarchaeota archaeon]MBT4422774.1 hypothetical protein [Candidatus Bathyarchaeota archaeon]MBT7348021.1 hypothetical protein [Candidatus Bathyarchaeota archaeon]
MSEAWRYTTKFTEMPCPKCAAWSLKEESPPKWVPENDERYIWKGELEYNSCGTQFKAGIIMIETREWTKLL